MKKTLINKFSILLGLTAMVGFTSCLKDKNYVDFAAVGTLVEIPLSGLTNFGGAAITDAEDTIVRQFAVNVASPNPLTTDLKVTVAVDNTIIDKYKATNSAVDYLPLPADAFVFKTTTVTIPGGTRTKVLSVTFYKNKLDPSKSYMLPITIKDGGGQKISGNFNTVYYHFIGNDFAGTYEHYYTRWNNADTTTAASTPRTYVQDDIFSPVSPTEINVPTYYYTGARYSVTFTKSGSGASATYSDWDIKFVAGDIAPGTQWGDNITIVESPQFRPNKIAFVPGKSYTFAESLKLFRFYFKTASRAIVDDYVKK